MPYVYVSEKAKRDGKKISDNVLEFQTLVLIFEFFDRRITEPHSHSRVKVTEGRVDDTSLK